MTRMVTWLWLLLLGVTLTNALAVVWTRHQSRMLFVQLIRLKNQRDALNIDYGRLELEQATWAQPQHIDRKARQQLGMVSPVPHDIRLVVQ